jgi:hypothetical protein
MTAHVYTATFDRPDVARIWREAIRRTLTTPHTVTILYAREAPGTDAHEATWQSVGLDERSRPQMFTVFKVMPQAGVRLFIEEDMIPVRPWNAEDYVGTPAILEGPGGQTWWGFTGYSGGPARPLMYSQWRYIPQRLITEEWCPEWVPASLRSLAIEAKAKAVGEHFIHVDKFSARHPHSEAKARLFEALRDYIDGLPLLGTAVTDPPALPSLAQRVANFSKAVVKHVRDRGRQCTDDEIAARFAICEQCPLLVDNHCTHKNCGCGISPKRSMVSKLTWASESCPVGKWSAIDS